MRETYRERSGAAPVPATYRERLRVEGAVLAVSGALAGLTMLAAVGEASDRAGSTIGQLVFVALLLAALAPVIARRSLTAARPAERDEQVSLHPPIPAVNPSRRSRPSADRRLSTGSTPRVRRRSTLGRAGSRDSSAMIGGSGLSGEPTALWKPPLVVVVLAAAFVVPGELGIGPVGWDAGVRIAGGCALVGLAQALLFARVVGADERRSGRIYVRLPGRGMTSGTKLGFLGGKQA